MSRPSEKYSAGFTPYHFFLKSGKGFTLIELLVVIAIIALLSSVILASLAGARGKAQDTAVRAQALQLRNILELEFETAGSYATIKAGGAQSGGEWYGVGSVCSGFSGPYAANAIAVCNALVKATGAPCGTDGCVFFKTAGPPTGPTADSPVKYSIIAYLPYASKVANADRFLCVGSSKRQSVTADPAGASPGCWTDP